MEALEPKTYLITLKCHHRVKLDFKLLETHHDDYHLIPCPTCGKTKKWFDSYQIVTHVTELPYEMCDVLKRISTVLPRQILRIQPRYKGKLAHRANPFPYRNRKNR